MRTPVEAWQSKIPKETNSLARSTCKRRAANMRVRKRAERQVNNRYKWQHQTTLSETNLVKNSNTGWERKSLVRCWEENAECNQYLLQPNFQIQFCDARWGTFQFPLAKCCSSALLSVCFLTSRAVCPANILWKHPIRTSASGFLYSSTWLVYLFMFIANTVSSWM